jgi:plasmid stabilization system protein ParE
VKPLRWKDSAVIEVEQAADFYEERMEWGGRRFREKLWTAIVLVREYPDAGAPYGLRFRRSFLGDFPYSVVYLSEPEAIYVVAVRHDRMMPVRWEELL